MGITKCYDRDTFVLSITTKKVEHSGVRLSRWIAGWRCRRARRERTVSSYQQAICLVFRGCKKLEVKQQAATKRKTLDWLKEFITVKRKSSLSAKTFPPKVVSLGHSLRLVKTICAWLVVFSSAKQARTTLPSQPSVPEGIHHRETHPSCSFFVFSDFHIPPSLAVKKGKILLIFARNMVKSITIYLSAL